MAYLFEFAIIVADKSTRLTSVSLPSYKMADGFEFVYLPTSDSDSSNLDIEYFAMIYGESLDTFRSYMGSLRQHLNLFYGAVFSRSVG
jgi:hypothetical protein